MRTFIGTGLVLMSLLILSTAVVVASPSDYVIETVDGSSVHETGWFCDLELDATGEPHIAYYDMDTECLRYASRLDGNWVNERIGGSNVNVGYYSSLALDANNVPHIAFFNSTFQDVYHATRDTGGGWALELVDGQGGLSRGMYCDIDLAPDGTIYISYMDGDNWRLYVARKQTGYPWVRVDLSEGRDSGWWTSIAVGNDGTPHLCDVENGFHEIGHHYPDAVQWHSQTIDSSVLPYDATAIALTDGNLPRFCYVQAVADGPDGVIYALPGPAPGMYTELVGDTEGQCSLDLDAAGNPNICYPDDDGYGLIYAHKTGSTWAYDEIDPETTVWKYCSIKLDALGIPHFAYFAEDNSLRYATLAPSTAAPPAADVASELRIFPNPAAAELRIGYRLPAKSAATHITIRDLDGRLIRELAAAPAGEGDGSVLWDERDQTGRRVGSGVYVVNVAASTGVRLRKKVTVVR